MNRKDFLKSLAQLPFAGAAMNLKELHNMPLEHSDRMPLLFLGHGNASFFHFDLENVTRNSLDNRKILG